jgi:hypothetical protein
MSGLSWLYKQLVMGSRQKGVSCLFLSASPKKYVVTNILYAKTVSFTGTEQFLSTNWHICSSYSYFMLSPSFSSTRRQSQCFKKEPVLPLAGAHFKILPSLCIAGAQSPGKAKQVKQMNVK